VAQLEIVQPGYAGIVAKAESTMPSGHVMRGLHLHHLSIRDTQGEGMYIGWTWNGYHDMADVEISHNRLENIGWDGIQLNTCVSGGYIHHNTITGYGSNSPTAVVEVNNPSHWHNDGITGGRNHVVIEHNRVEATSDGAGAGIMQKIYDDCTIRDNLVIHRGRSADPETEPGIHVFDHPSNPPLPHARVDVDHNTIITPEGAGLLANSHVPVFARDNLAVAPRGSHSGFTGELAEDRGNTTLAAIDDAPFRDPTAGDYRLRLDATPPSAGAWAEPGAD